MSPVQKPRHFWAKLRNWWCKRRMWTPHWKQLVPSWPANVMPRTPSSWDVTLKSWDSLGRYHPSCDFSSYPCPMQFSPLAWSQSLKLPSFLDVVKHPKWFSYCSIRKPLTTRGYTVAHEVVTIGSFHRTVKRLTWWTLSTQDDIHPLSFV